MSLRRAFSTIFGVGVLSTLAVLTNAQMTDEGARELALSSVRLQLHLRPDQFLGVHRDEDLEQSLAIVTGGRHSGSEFIYKVSQTGVEVRENAIVQHVATDANFTYIIAVSSRDEMTFRIHGFADAPAEFNKLMTAVGESVPSPDQAESVADFYRAVNPENIPLTPIPSLLELKQAAERQCQNGASSFAAGQEAFSAWWKHAKPLYAEVPFKQSAKPKSNGYLVEWTVLSSPSHENCGGAPLRAHLEISPDGHAGRVTFSPIRRN